VVLVVRGRAKVVTRGEVGEITSSWLKSGNLRTVLLIELLTSEGRRKLDMFIRIVDEEQEVVNDLVVSVDPTTRSCASRVEDEKHVDYLVGKTGVYSALLTSHGISGDTADTKYQCVMKIGFIGA